MKSIDNKTKLIRRFFAICEVSGTNKEMQTRIINSYGVESISGLTEEQIEKVCIELQRIPNIWRKRVIASIGGWLSVTHQEKDIDYIKAIACRSSKHDDFNHIPVSRLRDIYNEYLHKQETHYSSSATKGLVIAEIASKN